MKRTALSHGESIERLPVVGEELLPGPGPGGLVWAAITDKGVPGLRAECHDGAFVILRVSSRTCALFHERRPGDFGALALGGTDALKLHASCRRAVAPPRPLPPMSRENLRTLGQLLRRNRHGW